MGAREHADRGWRWFRWTMWGGAASLLLLPAIAMRFTAEVDWTGSDFVFAGLLLFGSAGMIELAARINPSLFYRAGVVAAVAAAFLILWANAAVGMIGSEDNPYNLLFVAAIALALIGAVAARFRPGGMALAMALAGAIHAVAGLVGAGADLRGGILSTLFAGLWFLAAALFGKAKRS